MEDGNPNPRPMGVDYSSGFVGHFIGSIPWYNCIADQKKGGFGVWKSSATPLACATLEQRAQVFICSAGDPTGMESSTNQLRVKFHRGEADNGGIWQLRR
ncbi:hypothetical protein BDV29DRAFT_185194, partial [Aspergillus leporis]